MRGWLASFTASHAASISPLAQRASEATVQFVTAAAMACTLLWSMGDAMAKPASITSTPSFSSWRAISIFSVRFMLQPGDCSPSRKVVSKILMRFMGYSSCSFFSRIATKKASVSSLEETKAQNFRGTTLVGIKYARFLHRLKIKRMRLVGNGEEIRLRLNENRLSGATQGPVTSSRSALPRSDRQLSEASVGRIFPRHGICEL